MALPVFKITDAGIAAANAHSGGPAIFISTFKIGSGYNYTPTGTESDIQGVELYNGVPTSLNLVSNQVLDVVVQIPANVGPFNFGEIALFLDDGTMFAIAAYEVLQEKLQQVVSGVANVWVIHCLLHLSPTPNVSFTLNNNSGVILPEVPHTGYVTGPIQMMNDPNAVIVHEATPGSESMLLIKHDDAEWTPVEYYFWKSGTVTAATFDDVTSAIFKGIGNYTANSLLVQDANGNLRGVKSIKGGGKVEYSHPSIQLNAGDIIKVYKYDALDSMGIDFTEGNPEAGDTVVVTPSVLAPASGAQNVSRTSIAVTSSAFSLNPSGPDAHQTTQWQVRSSNGSIIYDQTFSAPNLTSATLNFTQNLAIATTYSLRVKYKTASGLESQWSADSTFTTGGGVVVAINPPTIDATGSKPSTFTINASPNPMTVSGGSDTHIQTEFRFSITPQGSSPSVPNVLSSTYSGQVVGLSGGTTYYASARYRGQNLGWSAWGPDSTFTVQGSGGGGGSTAYVDPPQIGSMSDWANVDPDQPLNLSCINAATAVHNSTATVSQVTFFIYNGSSLYRTISTTASPSPSVIPAGTFQPATDYTIKAKYYTTTAGLVSENSQDVLIHTTGATASYNPVIHASKTTVIQGERVNWWITGAPPGPCNVTAPTIPGYGSNTITIAPDGTFSSAASPSYEMTSSLQPNTPSLPSYSFNFNFVGSGQNITKTASYIVKYPDLKSITPNKTTYVPGELVTWTLTFSPECTGDGGLSASPPIDAYNYVNFNEVPVSSWSDSNPANWNRATGVLTAYGRLSNVSTTQPASATVRDMNGHVFTPSVTISVPVASGSMTFTTNTTWTVPAGATNIRMSGSAGGGGGGGTDGPTATGRSSGGGGGGGEIINPGLPVPSGTFSPGDVLNITIGAGGAAGAVGVGSGYGTSGFDGGNTSITVGGTLKALFRGGKGGQGGAANLQLSNAGGPAGGPIGNPTSGENGVYGLVLDSAGGKYNGGDSGKAGGSGWLKLEW